MGYYTRFEGGVSGPTELLEIFKRDADKGATYGEYNMPLEDWLYEFFGGDTAKWYRWSEDMAQVSSRYPHLLFWLEGEGEESGDIWKAWARNGKVVTAQAKIVFDEPDLDKELPTPDVEEAVAKAKEEKRAALRDEIAALNAKLEKI